MKKIKKEIKIKPLIFILLISTIILTGATIAFFSARESFGNKFKVKAFDISIEEPDFEGEFGAKTVNIVNKDSTDIILRISINEIWSKNINDELVMLSNKVNGQEVVEKTRGINWEDFVDGKDGWYYYKKLLKAGEKIEVLKRIEINNTLNEEIKKEYESYDYELSYNYEGIQGTKEAIKEVWGLDVTINNDIINWNF